MTFICYQLAKYLIDHESIHTITAENTKSISWMGELKAKRK